MQQTEHCVQSVFRVNICFNSRINMDRKLWLHLHLDAMHYKLRICILERCVRVQMECTRMFFSMRTEISIQTKMLRVCQLVIQHDTMPITTTINRPDKLIQKLLQCCLTEYGCWSGQTMHFDAHIVIIVVVVRIHVWLWTHIKGFISCI